MDKVISLGYGIRRQPSIGTEGELSELVNLVPKNGELVNVREMAKEDVVLEEGDIVAAIHKTQSGDNIIAFGSIDNDSAQLYYYDEDWNRTAIGGERINISDKDHLPHVEILGNTISVLCAESIVYYLWKDGGYILLGNKPPQMNISFGLQCEGVRSEEFEVKPANGFRVSVTDGQAVGNPSYSSDDVEEITNAILAQVNKFIQEESLDKGRFMYPFFVRYAYRLYDGSLVMHSSPILMVCSTKCAPKVDIKRFHDLSDGVSVLSPKADFQVLGVTSALDFLPSADFDELKKWGDVVKSVDIFITRPISTYDPSGRVGSINIRTKFDESNYVIGKHVNRYNNAYKDYPSTYQRMSLDMVCGMTFSSNISINGYTINLPSKTDDEIRQQIKESSLFYFLDSFTIDKLSEIKERTLIVPKDDILETLPTREVMSDDYYSNDSLYADYALAYNSRLSLSGVKSILSNGKSSDSMFAHSDGFFAKLDNPSQFSTKQDVYYYVYIKEEGKDIIVGGESTLGSCGTIAAPCNKLLYFFYPNPNAYKLVVRTKRLVTSDGSINIIPNDWRNYTVSLEKHNLLNGAFFFGDWESGIVETSDAKGQTTNNTMQISSDRTVSHRGSIYTSDFGNPFFYYPSGINNLGFGDVIRIETSAKALSQGQFGQFPLYAFCTDGIWALEVANDGSYSAKQPISRDVCNNPDSITQIDGAVVFTTEQGLKMIQGSEVVLLSGAMDGHNVDENTYFPEGFFAAHKKFESDGLENFDALVVQETRDFRQILAKCKIAYDYPNKLLRIFPKGESGKPYKYYVYSLESREFASVIGEGEAKSIVSGYPSSLLQIDTNIYTFDAAIGEGMKRGLLLTRPIDMGEPFALKKLLDMRLYYTKYNQGSMCKAVLYVSNDGIKWAEVKSLRGGSYKYFRIALITEMTDNDRLSGIALRYELNRGNKLR